MQIGVSSFQFPSNEMLTEQPAGHGWCSETAARWGGIRNTFPEADFGCSRDYTLCDANILLKALVMGILDRFFGPPPADRFARQMIEVFREVGSDRDYQYDAEQFRLVGGERGKEILNLQNFYAEHCGLPRKLRKQHLRQVVRGVLQSQLELPDEFEHAKPDLRPKLWMRAAFTKLNLRQKIEGGDGMDVPLYPLGEHLSIGIVYDLPHSMRSLTNSDLEEWDTSWYEALEAARHSLEDCEFTFAKIGESLYASLTGDNYDASRILLQPIIEQLEVDGVPVAMVPNRDCLLVTGENDKMGISMMAEIAAKALDDPRPMSAHPLRLEGDQWVDWMPPKSHPAYQDLVLLQTQFMYQEYADQKALLDQYHEAEMIDIFVASCSALQNKNTDEVFTYCVWGEDVDSLLPKTDRIMLAQDGGGIASAEWDQVVSVVGDLIVREEDYYPERFRVREFPTRQQLEAIGLDEH